MIRAHIDFEFNSTAEPKLNLVSCAIKRVESSKGEQKISPTESFWLVGGEDRDKLLARLKELREERAIFCAWYAPAECSSFLALDLNPLDYRWFDLKTMYAMLLNQKERFMYQEQLIDGKEVYTYPSRMKEINPSFSSKKAQKSLVAATYKLLGIRRDSEHKDQMRDLIISNPDSYTEEQKNSIIDYCKEDVEHMEDLFQKLVAWLQKYLKIADWDNKKFVTTFLGFGEYGALTALMERKGYPVNTVQLYNFRDNVGKIINDMCRDINEQNLPFEPFKWNKRRGSFSLKEKELREWLEVSFSRAEWEQTSKRQYSLSLEAWQKKYNYSHDYPRDCLGAQMVRFKKLKQSLNGIAPKPATAKNKKTIFDFLGSDGRVRPMMGIYGSQSSRSQPSAISFIPLKAAWMRALIQPNSGKMIVGIDWGSQEFLISAIISKDKNMYEAYTSGDPYFHFAKLAKAVPKDAKKEDHKQTRQLFKSTVLGIMYNMGVTALAKKLSNDTGMQVSEDKARELQESFFKVFKKFAKYVEEIKSVHFEAGMPLSLPDGWTMFGDNPNWRSVTNMPIQGHGAVIMRLAVKYAYMRGIDIIYTLHDALYAEVDTLDLEAVDSLYQAMSDAFQMVWEDETQQEWAKAIRQDIDIWGPDLQDMTYITPEERECKGQTIYIDERSQSDYNRFKKYF